MKKWLIKQDESMLLECVKTHMEYSEKSIIPDFMVDVVDVLGDGSCRFRAIADNINKFKNEKSVSQKRVAEIFYSLIKDTVLNVLPSLTNNQLIKLFGFESLDPSISPTENIDNHIGYAHSPYINNLREYSKKFKYGTYTTDFEMQILFSKYLKDFWRQTFDIPTPCVTIYIPINKSLVEISCSNRTAHNFINFRLLYIGGDHYQAIYIKPEYSEFNKIILKNGCKITS